MVGGGGIRVGKRGGSGNCLLERARQFVFAEGSGANEG